MWNSWVVTHWGTGERPTIGPAITAATVKMVRYVAIVACALWGFFLPVQAGIGLVPGFPPCLGGEAGYWQPYVVERDDRLTVFIVLTTEDFLDASLVICWISPDQQLRTLLNPMKTHGQSRRAM